MGNAEVHSISPVRDDERRQLNLSRHISYKQYCKHVEGKPHESSLDEIPWNLRDSISLYEHMNAAFNAITEIPAELPLRLPHLNYIDFSHNQLTELPNSFGLLFHLRTVILKFNKIKSLPESFFHLIKLEKIDISNNLIKSLPDEFTRLQSLTKLNVSNNRLKKLPVSLGGVPALKVLLASENRLQDPPQNICDGGSEEIILYLRKNYNLCGHASEQLLIQGHNVFPRVRGNHLQSSVPNPHSAQVQYIQSQTHTTNTASRIKTPLLPPPEASALDADTLRDRIVGLLYGAAIGDAIGIATCCMSMDECRFHYNPEGLSFKEIVQDELRVRWRQGDWTSNFDTMVLLLESVIGWAGVVDELDYAKKLHHWCEKGFPELGDKVGVVLSETVKQVTEHPEFLKHPHTASKHCLDSTSVHLYAIENGVVRSDDDCSSISSDISSISEQMAQSGPTLFPSSHPCIPSKKFGTDNGAIVQIAILGVPNFHLTSEVEANTVRICRSTHSHPLCVASCVTITNLISTLLQGKQDLDCYKSIDDLIHKASNTAVKYIQDKAMVEEFNHYVNCTSVSGIKVSEQFNMSYTLKAMAAGLVALRSQQSFRSYMMNLIMEGGDSNSNGCVAGALLGCKVGYSRLPQEWIQGLRKKQTTWLNVKINCLLDMMGIP